MEAVDVHGSLSETLQRREIKENNNRRPCHYWNVKYVLQVVAPKCTVKE